ncbi:MAG: diguanylate cyclase [Methyloprofundus sp.]|nr:diguanylate cyclase [Methyloprofundus sp.]
MSDALENSIDKVLIVDDNLQNLALMQAALKQERINIYTAQSGALALDILYDSDNEFALIIMDVSMPILTGIETVKIIQESSISNNTPIIFISSQCKAEADIEEGFKTGAHDYILRPIDIPLFRNKVKTFLRLYRTEKELKYANLLLAEKAAELDRQLAEQLKINSDLKFSEQVFENSVNGIIVVDEEMRFVRVNKAFTEITGYSLAELIGKTPKILSSGVQDKEFYDDMWGTLINKGAWQGELWNRRKSNELYAEMLSINAVKDSRGIVSNYIGIVSDITEKKRDHEKNEHLANYDYLTGLPNRLLLMTTLQKHIANKELDTMAILFLDLDKFKPVNDDYGHQVGDDLLVAVAKRLRACVRDRDLVARLGGDEFIIVLKRPKVSVQAAEKVAKKIITAISAPFNISGQQISINTSIGIALYPEHANDADSLITLADNAMYRSKDDGAGYFHFCTDIIE